jgi:hypothetical protein
LTWLALAGWLDCQTAKSQPGIPSCPRMSELNEYAFFVLLFGQLEDYVNQEYVEFMGSLTDQGFEARVGVVFDEDSETAELITDYYHVRCAIAHGHAESGQMGDHIRLPEVYEQIQGIIAY